MSEAQRTRPIRILAHLFRPEGPEIRSLILFAVVVGMLTLVTPLAVESLVNTVAFIGLLQPIVILAVMMLLCLGLAAILLALEAYLVELIQRRMFARVVTSLSRRLPRAQLDAMDGVSRPELANRFFELPILQKVGAKLLLDGVTVGLSAAVGLVVLAFYHPLLLAFGVVLVALLAVVIFLIGRGAIRSATDESTAKYRNADWSEQILSHQGAFRSGRGLGFAAERGDELAQEYLDRRRGHYRLLFRQLAGALLLQVVMSTLLMGLGGWLVTINQLTLGQLVAAWLIVSIVLSAVAKLGAQLESLYDILASCGKLGALLELPVDRTNGMELPGNGPVALRLCGLEHPRVGFAGGDGSGLVDVPAGSKLAIFGPSGSGKSTLLEVLSGQRATTAGHLEVDGVHLDSLQLDSLRRNLATVVSGDVFAGTVHDNLAMGRTDVGIDELRAALDSVGLQSVIERLEGGLGARLTSDGEPLSSTHADLLVLARALLARPRLMMVDGLLDRLDGPGLERALDVLLASNAPWTVVLAAQRKDVAEQFESRLELQAREPAGGERIKMLPERLVGELSPRANGDGTPRQIGDQEIRT